MLTKNTSVVNYINPVFKNRELYLSLFTKTYNDAVEVLESSWELKKDLILNSNSKITSLYQYGINNQKQMLYDNLFDESSLNYALEVELQKIDKIKCLALRKKN